ncbi:MAG: helix-turn-helix domain-containing protein [Verrucomicrobiia bacterium]|jgi:excisionase family DNA binding protein
MSDSEEKATKNWFTIKDAAAYLDIGEQTLYRWMRDGKVTFRKVGDSTRFMRTDLDALVEVHASDKDINEAKRRCPVCQSSEIFEGTVQSTGKLYFRPGKTKFWTWRQGNVNTEARACGVCGHLMWFADLAKLKALQQPAK